MTKTKWHQKLHVTSRGEPNSSHGKYAGTIWFWSTVCLSKLRTTILAPLMWLCSDSDFENCRVCIWSLCQIEDLLHLLSLMNYIDLSHQVDWVFISTSYSGFCYLNVTYLIPLTRTLSLGTTLFGSHHIWQSKSRWPTARHILFWARPSWFP